MKIIIKKDWEWYLAEVKWFDNLYAYWETKESAEKELLWVVEMTMDYHLELAEKEKNIKNFILNNKNPEYALQV